MLDFFKPSVRAIVAVGSIAATVGFMLSEVSIPGEWWVVVTAITTFYFTQVKPE